MKIFLSFCAGSAATSILLTIILANVESGDSKRIKAEAVAAGVAEWIVSYDSNGSPVLEFRWKSERQ